jgi:hypothetical protein
MMKIFDIAKQECNYQLLCYIIIARPLRNENRSSDEQDQKNIQACQVTQNPSRNRQQELRHESTQAHFNLSSGVCKRPNVEN